MTGPPSVNGTAVVGKTLKVGPGTCTPAGVTLTYQWFAGAKAIKKATKEKLRLTDAQVRKKISVQITATVPGYTALTVRTNATKKIKARPKK